MRSELRARDILFVVRRILLDIALDIRLKFQLMARVGEVEREQALWTFISGSGRSVCFTKRREGF